MGFFDLFGDTDNNDEDDTFQVGDRVRVIYRGQEGHIIDKNGSLYTVSLNDGEYVDCYEASELEEC